LPGDGEYDRGERKAWRDDFKSVLAGCGIVVGIVIATYAVYTLLLVLSGWRGD
jgi:hypothetical protein